jgi:iron complex outermembrane receptor protein
MWFGRVVAVPIALVALLGTPVLSAAEQSTAISGVVSDQTGAAVPGATVELAGAAAAGRSATTDGAGRYRFEGLQPGQYTVRVSLQGFQSTERALTVAASGWAAADFRLAVELAGESVLVTAERAKAEVEAQRAATPGGVTVVEGEELYRRHTRGIADVVRYVPGVWAESFSGGDEMFFSSRGSNLDSIQYDKNGIKLLQDGLPITTADGNNHNRLIDPLTARFATMARGANALTYGASTLGGAMDFVSPTARNSAPLSLFLNGGSHGSLSGRASVGRASDTLDGLLTFELQQWDGYRDHSEQDRWGVYANTGWQISPSGNLQLFGTYVDNDQNIPGALTRAEVDADPDQAFANAISGDYGKEVKTARVAAKTTWSFGSNRMLTAGLSYEEQSLYHPIVDRIFVDFDGPGPNPPVEVFSLLIDTDHKDLGAVVRYDHSVGAHDLRVGVNYGDGSVEGGNYRNLNGQPNGISSFVDNKADSLEAFVVDNWRASSRFSLVFGAQYVNGMRDVRTTDAASGVVSNPNATFSSFNPRVGVIVSLNNAADLYGNVSRLYEAPTTMQMEDNVEGGNATLDPMSGWVAEIGWRSKPNASRGTRWTWDVNAYYAGISDEIMSVDDPAAPGNSLSTNIDKTIHAGLEALVSASFALGSAHRVNPTLSASLNHFKFDGDPIYGDNDLPAAPSYAVRGEVLYKNLGGFYAGPTFDFVGERYADLANNYLVDGHVLMGLRAGYTSKHWELFGDVRNLFDTEYTATVLVFNVAGPNARVLNPGEPLSAYIGARFSF